MQPMVYIWGPTGSSKTSSVVLAAVIAGDQNSSIVWQNSPERNRQAVMDAKEDGSYVTFNEVLKERGSNGMIQDAKGKLDMILNLTPDSRSHKLYRGSVKMGSVPVIVFTDTNLPIEIKTDRQLARRLTVCALYSQVNWESSLRDTGVNKIEYLRTADVRYADACNVVLSSVIDDFFSEPLTFKEIALKLGFHSVEDCDEAKEGAELLLQFFHLVLSSPELSGVNAKRWKGRGWKLVDRQVETELLDYWSQLADNNDGQGWSQSRKCTEIDWGKLVLSPHPVAFETRSHGTKLVMRFVSKTSRKDYLVNGELL